MVIKKSISDMPAKRGILFVINDFRPGGAELFVLRLGTALIEEYNVYIMDIYPDRSNVEFEKLFTNAGFKTINRFVSQSILRESIYWKINALFLFIGIKGMYTRLTNTYKNKKLLNTLKKHNIRIIHSHYYSSDYYSVKTFNNNQFKKIVTMHGDYNQGGYESMTTLDREKFFLNVMEIVAGCDALTFVADLNISILDELSIKPKFLKKISLGYEAAKNIIENKKEDIKIFTFCMVARANTNKGWKELIEAFVVLNKKYQLTKLVCVGPIEGILKQLKDKYSENAAIEFSGYVSDTSSYIQKSDVCVLPTYFNGESTPYSIIEYLAWSKPVISTKMGEIQDMLTHEGNLAGIVLDAEQLKKAQYKELIDAMEKLMMDKELYRKTSDTARLAFNKFSMQECKSKYVELYTSVLTNYK